MADAGRKDLSTQAGEALKPDSQKGLLEKAQEGATDAADKVASAVQPGDSKSTTQKLSDTAQSGTSNTGTTGKTYLEQAQEVAGNAYETVSKAATDLASSITGEKK